MEILAVYTCVRLNTSEFWLTPWYFNSSLLTSYGWDWGPVLMTTGPWRPIALQTYDARITDLRVQTQVSELLDVVVKVSLDISSPVGQTIVVLKDTRGQVVRQSDSLSIANGNATVVFEGAKDEFDLWYPVGYGKQPMYVVQVYLTDKVRV